MLFTVSRGPVSTVETANEASTLPRVFGRFKSTYLNGDLYRLVGEFAETLSADDPSQLRQTIFDAKRAELGYPDLPSARQIAKRLRRPWREVVAIATNPTRNFERTDDRSQSEVRTEGLDRRHIHFALNYVAQLLGQESVSPDQYELQRQELLDQDAHRWQYGGVLVEVLPSRSQIEIAAKNLLDLKPGEDWWGAASQLAGLKPHVQRQKSGMGVCEALHWYAVCSGGYLASGPSELTKFARWGGLAMAAAARKPWDEHLDEFRVWCLESGYTFPLLKRKRGQKLDLIVPPGGIPGAKQRHDPAAHTEGRAVAFVARYIREGMTGSRPTVKEYKAWAVKHGGPSPSNFGDWGGWSGVRNKAIAEARGGNDPVLMAAKELGIEVAEAA